MEQLSIERLKLLHPKLRESGLAAYDEAVRKTPEGVHPLITQTLRTFEESNTLYAQGRTKPGKIVTNARAGASYHNYGLALDFVLVVGGKVLWKVDENWMTVVKAFKDHGFFWGGDFKSLKDYPHFENRFGYTWRQLLAKHNSKDFIEGTNYVKL